MQHAAAQYSGGGGHHHHFQHYVDAGRGCAATAVAAVATASAALARAPPTGVVIRTGPGGVPVVAPAARGGPPGVAAGAGASIVAGGEGWRRTFDRSGAGGGAAPARGAAPPREWDAPGGAAGRVSPIDVGADVRRGAAPPGPPHYAGDAAELLMLPRFDPPLGGGGRGGRAGAGVGEAWPGSTAASRNTAILRRLRAAEAGGGASRGRALVPISTFQMPMMPGPAPAF